MWLLQSHGRSMGWALLVLLLVPVHSNSLTAEGQCEASAHEQTSPNGGHRDRLSRVKAVWRRQQLFEPSQLDSLRHTAWNMFDHGFSSYMQHAFPMDNLMPLTCKGQNWQGGLALTLVDSLDTLALMNRRSDLQEAVQHLRNTLNFDKDAKVHVFETTIRVLGGLLSGHVLLHEDPGLVPGYDGLLLREAQDLGDRLMAAFDTPSGLPGGHVHLQKGIVAGENISCTACAGTLLLEFGLLSKLTGNDKYMRAAHHAAAVLYERRSPLGLVGSSFHVGANTWSHLGSTIGPGSDSYYEYLLKAYLMFGDRQYLDMFIELYAATMKHMKLPGGGAPLQASGKFGSAFLLDVHMDSGRLLKPWVSSLGAFWPAMQALAGQSDDAQALHNNFTSAWATWGWLPEVFGVDLGAVHPEDPGYNLRPEHIESTWYLAALTGDPTGQYRGLAANMLQVLNHSWVGCGYAPISDVKTGVHTDLMESYFLSETVKYLYLSFVDSGALLDYYVLSTEGHIMPSYVNPVDAHVEEEDHLEVLLLHHQEQTQLANKRAEERHAACLNSSSNTSRCALPDSSHARLADFGAALEDDSVLQQLSLVGEQGVAALPDNCRALCQARSSQEEAAVQLRLHQALPLLPLDMKASRRIRYRRCVACIKTTQALAEMPEDPIAAQLARFNFGQKSSHSPLSSSSSKQRQAASSTGSSRGSRAAAVSAARVGALSTVPVSTDIEALPSSHGVVVLAQALCLLRLSRRQVECEVLRPVTALDTTSLLPQNAVIMQLSGLKANALPAAAPALLVALQTEEGGLSTLHAAAALAGYGPDLPLLPDKCVAAMLASPPDLQLLPQCPLRITVNPYWRPDSTSSSRGVQQKIDPWMQGYLIYLQQQQKQEDPWLLMSPTSVTCSAVRAQQQQEQQQTPAPSYRSGGAAVSAPISLTPVLLGNCLGYDPSTYVAYWLPQPYFFNSSHPCSSFAVTAAATRSALAAGAPSSALLPITAPLVLADPPRACTRLHNSHMLRGSIAVVSRGGCSFVEKAIAANRAGALGLVMLNHEAPGQLLTMSDDGSGRSPDIPTVMLEANDSKALLFWLERRPMVATLLGHSSPPPPGKAQLTPWARIQQLQRQQQGSKQQQQGAGKGSSAAPAATPSDEIVQKRIDLFVPGRSQPWLQQNILKAGVDGQTAYQSLARDPKVLQVLQQAFASNKARNGVQQPLTGERAASSVTAHVQPVMADAGG